MATPFDMRRSVAAALVLGLALVVVMCNCGESHPPGSGDAGTAADAAVDGGGVGIDAGSDAGPMVGFPAGWELVPWLPEWCDTWRPTGPADEAIEPLHFEPCEPPSAGCDQLAVDWERGTVYNSYFTTGDAAQTSGGRLIALNPVVLESRTVGRSRESLDHAVFDLGGQPVAVFRQILHDPEERISCRRSGFTTHGERVAFSYRVSNGMWEETHDDDDFSLLMVVDDVERLQHTDNVVFDLDVADILSIGNGVRALFYDGSNLIMRAGGVYVGSLGGGPWGEIATGRTDDVENDRGALFDGTFYWSSVPVDHRAWTRIRRRRPGASVNEVFLERTGAPGTGVASFRVDGTWAVWTEHIDDGPVDGVPDRAELYASSTGGSVDPASWTPRLVMNLGPIGPVQATYWNGFFAFIVDDSAFDRKRALEVIDLERWRHLRIDVETGRWWQTLLHLGDEYLIAVHHDPAGTDGMRRYRLSELSGWEDM